MKRILVAFAVFATLTSACSKEPPAAKRPVRIVLSQGLDAAMLEQEILNIQYWRGLGAKDRVLVHVSALEGLTPVPEDVLKAVRKEGFLKEGSVRPENLVYLAHRLGIVKEVYWVVPKFTGVTAEDLQGYKSYLKETYPGQEKNIDALKLSGAVAGGNIHGVPVKLMGLEDIPGMAEPALINIDTSFFTALYEDEEKIRLLAMVSGFANTLKGRGVPSDIVTLSYSAEPGITALRLRVVADYLTAMLKDPGMLSKDPPHQWAERAAAWKAERRSYREAAAIYKNMLKENPGDAAARFDLANAYFNMGDFTACRTELDKALAAAPAYGAAYAVYAERLSRSKNSKKAEIFLSAAGPR